MPVSNRTAGVSSPRDALRPYEFHGLHLDRRGSHGVGDCPFCRREGKFSADIASGLWRCWVCGAGTAAGGGNALVFLRCRFEAAGTPQAASGGGAGFWAGVAADRRLCREETPRQWGVRPSPLDGAWMVPGYGPDGALDQLYRRVRVLDRGEWSWRLLPTPGVWPEGKVHALHLPAGDYDPRRAAVVVCEGPWDGMALWECRRDVWGDANIIAVPGCNVWRDEWTGLCRGKAVTLLYDSDHPTLAGGAGEREMSAGRDGMRRVSRRLAGVAASVQWVRWGPDGWATDRPSGWDVRDELSGGRRTDPPLFMVDRGKALAGLLSRIEPVPADWSGTGAGYHLNGQARRETEAQECRKWDECLASWDVKRGGALRWRRDLTDALAVLLGVCASTKQGGNQLFLQLVGAAGGGKTTLCEGLLVSDHCHHLEHLSSVGFYSGWKKADDPGKDCSLIARINGKTLVTPEADVLMSDPNFDKLMGQQRRIFDGKGGATYGNSDEDRLYVALRTPWIMAGTKKMMDHGVRHQAHLGDRFLRVVIPDPDQDEKRAIVRAAVRSERSAMLEQSNCKASSVVDPKLRRAHALTGGYVDYLRASVEELLPGVLARVDERTEERCTDLAELSADLRARPNEDKTKVEVHDGKELPTRLARQNLRLAACLAVVLNKPAVDDEVMHIVRRVAMDTAFGHSLNIAYWMTLPHPRNDGMSYQQHGGMGVDFLATWACMTAERMGNYLSFLKKIGVVEVFQGQRSSTWVLTERVYDLYTRCRGW